jgi:hypothetical protein
VPSHTVRAREKERLMAPLIGGSESGKIIQFRIYFFKFDLVKIGPS